MSMVDYKSYLYQTFDFLNGVGISGITVRLRKHFPTLSDGQIFDEIFKEDVVCPFCLTQPRVFINLLKGYKPTCGQPRCWKKLMEQTLLNKYGYKHASQIQVLRDKQKSTMRERYGVEYALQSSTIKNKVQTNNMQKYGVHTTALIPEVIEKKKRTMKERYGVENNLSHGILREKMVQAIVKKYGVHTTALIPEVVEKKKQTNLRRYGTENPLCNELVRIKSEQTNVSLYGSKNVLCNSSPIRKKAQDRMMERYGTVIPLQSPIIKEKYKKIVQEKFHTTMLDGYTSLDISIIQKLSNLTWLKDQHLTQKKTMSQIAKELDVDKKTISNWFDKHGLDYVRYYGTSQQERNLSEALEKHNICVQTNVRVLDGKEIDIFLPEYNIGIEICGLFWHSDFFERMIPTYHSDKMKTANEKGIRLFTIFEDELRDKFDLCLATILHSVGLNTTASVGARKCSTVGLTAEQTKSFFEKTHILGAGNSSVCYGLMYKNEIVAAISFLKQQNGQWLLNRFSTPNRSPGAFTKLLKFFVALHTPANIITFADMRWSEGSLYDKSGFTLDAVLPPDYQYVVQNNTFRSHKFNFRHKHLKYKLENYDPTLTELQNTRNHKIYRIWNCGLKRYTLQVN